MVDLGSWVTGFTDGEGCFYAEVTSTLKTTTAGREVSCCNLYVYFSIALRADDRPILEEIRDYFGCGTVTGKKSAATCPSMARYGLRPSPQACFSVKRATDIRDFIIPHFEKYPLRTKKARDFDHWKKIIAFYFDELAGTKGWATHKPKQLAMLQSMCGTLKAQRKFAVVGG